MAKQNPAPVDVCVIGAGITGLTLAYRLQTAGRRVALLERRDLAGGVIRTAEIDGFLFDQGPNSTLTKTPSLEALVDELDLRDRVRYANEQAANRFVLKNGRLCQLPMSPPAFLKSGILSWRGKLRIAAEPFIPAKRDGAPETIADFVRRRLGQEALDYLVNPFVAGVYAGDPEQIDLQSALPRLAELERRYGGLIRGAIGKKRENRDKQLATGPKGRLLSFDRGMQVLAQALAAKLGSALIAGAEVEAITTTGDGATVTWRDRDGKRQHVQAGQVVLATPAYRSAALLEGLDAGVAKALHDVAYVPVAVVFHGYRREQVANPLDGFGFLVPEKEQRRILGTIWSSTIFPQRAPDGHVALTTFVGGARQPELGRLAEPELLALVEDELAALLGASGEPVLRRVMYWQRAIPQYGRDHPRILAAIANFEQAQPAIRLTGNFREGVSVSDCVDYALRTADALLEKSHVGREAENDRPHHSEARHPAATPAAQ